MSFSLGNFNSDSVPGFKAILTQWPTLPMQNHFEDLPLGDGSLLSQSSRGSLDWVFRLELTGSNVAEVMDKQQLVTRGLNSRVLQDFIPNASEGWTWQGIVNSSIQWSRDGVLWFSDQGISILHGEVTITTPDPYGYSAETSLNRTGAGSFSVNLNEGTDAVFPTITFRGALNTVQRFSVDGFEITGPLTSSQTLVLDFDKLDFYIVTTSTGARVRNVAERIESFKRVQINPGANSIPVGVSAGTFTRADLFMKSRRI